jgi:glycosyltransferase involved in cell wall biosynthesis
MESLKSATKTQLPTFSIILETENLINADLDGLSQSLASLIGQTTPLSQAEEVLIIDSGDVPAELIADLQARHPWLKVHRTEEPMEYYEAKMLGAQLSRGEVVVYCDSDCIYEPNWLQNLLTPFTNHQINLVAGETTTSGLGPYGTAMALGYIFPQYSAQEGLQPARQYFLNNVAFRRQFLLKHPIPTQLPLYRGNCHIHALQLLKADQQLWRQPQARSLHAPPNGLSHFFWRFLLIGHDAYWQKRVQAQLQLSSLVRGYQDPISGKTNKIGVFEMRLRGLIARDRRHLLVFPLALPVLLASSFLILVGRLITVWRPDYLLAAYNRVLVAQGQQPIALYPQTTPPPINTPAKSAQEPYTKAKQIS